MLLQAPYRRESDSNIASLDHMRTIKVEYTLVFHLGMKYKYVEFFVEHC